MERQSPATSDDVEALASLLHPWLDGAPCPYRTASLCVNSTRSRELARTLATAGYRRSSRDAAEVTAAVLAVLAEERLSESRFHTIRYLDRRIRDAVRSGTESAATPREAEPTRDDRQAATVCEHGFRPEPGRCPAGCTVATHTRDDGQPAPVLTEDEREHGRVDPRLLRLLIAAGDEWGPLGVLRTAAHLWPDADAARRREWQADQQRVLDSPAVQRDAAAAVLDQLGTSGDSHQFAARCADAALAVVAERLGGGER